MILSDICMIRFSWTCVFPHNLLVYFFAISLARLKQLTHKSFQIMNDEKQDHVNVVQQFSSCQVQSLPLLHRRNYTIYPNSVGSSPGTFFGFTVGTGHALTSLGLHYGPFVQSRAVVATQGNLDILLNDCLSFLDSFFCQERSMSGRTHTAYVRRMKDMWYRTHPSSQLGCPSLDQTISQLVHKLGELNKRSLLQSLIFFLFLGGSGGVGG